MIIDFFFEIVNILIHLLDPQQNATYHDRYFQGIPFDLSKALVFLSLNNQEDLDPILANRVQFVHMNPQTDDDKIKTAVSYLVPRAVKSTGFLDTDLIFSTDILRYMLEITQKEPGMRFYGRTISTVCLKLNCIIMLVEEAHATGNPICKVNTNVKCIKFPICYPICITKELVDSLLKDSTLEECIRNRPPLNMYI